MGFERISLFGTIELDMEATGIGTLTLSTDLPGVALTVRETKATPITSRRPVRFRLSGTTKGHIYTVKLVPWFGSQTRLYGGRIWARVMPGPWDWYPIAVPPTGEWQPMKLAIPPMGEWQPQPLAIPPTGEWQPQALGIPPTGEWTREALPIKPTPPLPEWASIPVDA